MNRFFILCGIIFLCLIQSVEAQDPSLKNYDHIYVDHIKSVKFHINGLLLSYPIVELGTSTQLRLSFDDLDGDNKNYVYSFIHCNQDWQPSQLTEMEYLDGFSDERFNDFRFSFRTIKNFTHYELLLPNNYTKWRVSGNYILVVYEDEGDKIPVITKRFVVVESKVQITPTLTRTAKVSKSRTHHEIDFIVDHDKFPLRNPRQEIRAVVLQNGRWDNAIERIEPLFLRSNRMLFDYQDKITFPANNEFRQLDLRTLRFNGPNIASIERLDDIFKVQLFRDELRFDQPYLFFQDTNGDFVIESLDENNFELSSDYADVLFILKTPKAFPNKEVYITGAFENWEMLERNKMTYNPAINSYIGRLRLKQGFYSYGYGVRDKDDDETYSPDFSLIEGNFRDTENQYTILVYYRPFGERYDRVIGAVTFSSFQ